MYHSITFGDKNTWDDWHLIPSSRPVFNPPAMKTNYVDIPGGDGHLDLSTAISGEPVYENRSGSIEFIVDNGHEQWFELYSQISDYLHGQNMKAILEDEPGYYYIGRFTVNQWLSEPHNSKITINYNVHPYKFERFSSLEDWEWDLFSFETGIVREYSDLVVEGTLTFDITGRRKSIVPSFYVVTDDSKGLDVEFKGVPYHLDDGISIVPGLVIKEGNNTLVFTGNGTVSIDYRGGRL